MKYTLPLLLCFAVCCTAFGQAPNKSALKIESLEIVAEVNGEKITRNSLAAECLQLHGENELYGLVRTMIIRLECERQNIVITAEEINAEVLRWAQGAGLTTEQLLKTLEQQRGVLPEQFRQIVIWEILALRKIAGARLNPSVEELQTAYDAKFGSAVRARQIVLSTKEEAEKILAELKQHPETFAAVAKNKSIDTETQAYGGMLFPIRRHSFHPDVEKILFSLKEGELSPVIQMLPGHFTIFKCEGYLEPPEVDVEAERKELFFQLRDAKQNQVTAEIFNELRNRTQLQIIFGKPELYSQYPGVAALVGNQRISIQELAEVSTQRHGTDVIGDMINRLIIEQACRRENIRITEHDIDKEIWEMAFNYLPLDKDGKPNIKLWIEKTTEESGLSEPMYRKNVVAPVLSLKRLTRPLVQVTEEDIDRSFEANYGVKVRCLAIVFDGQDTRRAEEAWRAANRQKTAENFGDLAEKYSFDPDARLGRGVLPPISRHCGQPIIEREAFALKPGELSQILHVDDHLVILYCVGYTDPVPVEKEKVRAEMIADIFVNKQKYVIARYFERLHEQAVLTNYLTGTSQNPALERAIQEGATLQR